MRKLFAVAIVVSILIMSGCGWFKAKAGQNPQPLQTSVSVGNLWSIEDNRTVAALFINEALNAGWFQNFSEQYQRKPVLMVRSVVNMTTEPLPVDGFVKDLSRELLKSGKVRLVTVREDQTEDGNMDVAGGSGAEFAFKGLIELTGNTDKGARSKLYRAELILVELKTGEPVWKTETTIQKQNIRN